MTTSNTPDGRKKKTAEEYYQDFIKMGYSHQEARELALRAVSFNEKVKEAVAKTGERFGRAIKKLGEEDTLPELLEKEFNDRFVYTNQLTNKALIRYLKSFITKAYEAGEKARASDEMGLGKTAYEAGKAAGKQIGLAEAYKELNNEAASRPHEEINK